MKRHSINSRLQRIDKNKTIDPVCGRKMNKNKAFIIIHHQGEKYYICCPRCQSEFEADPGKYINKH